MSLVAESLGYWDLPKPEEKEKINGYLYLEYQKLYLLDTK